MNITEISLLTKEDMEKALDPTKKRKVEAVQNNDFEQAAILRDLEKKVIARLAEPGTEN